MKDRKKIIIVLCIVVVIIIAAIVGVSLYMDGDNTKNNVEQNPVVKEEEPTEIVDEAPIIKFNTESEEAVEVETNLSRIRETDIYYEFGADKIFVKDYIDQWITPNGDDAIFDEELVREFINGLSRKYDTFGISREFRTHDGETITVKGGTYGWWMNRPAETQELIEAIKRGDSGQRIPEYYSTAVQYGDNDIGNTYVEVDLTKQHLWVYENGAVIEESDFVSGNISKGNGTHTGTYGITYKERDATLAGQGYSSPVSYWMPFNENEGMHDAKWRNEFGGEIYLRDGSHGCLNLPVDKAASIYEKVHKDEPVVVYGGKTEVPALTPEEQIALLIQAGLLNPDGTPVDIEGAIPQQPVADNTVQEQSGENAEVLPDNIVEGTVVAE